MILSVQLKVVGLSQCCIDSLPLVEIVLLVLNFIEITLHLKSGPEFSEDVSKVQLYLVKQLLPVDKKLNEEKNEVDYLGVRGGFGNAEQESS